jgi:superfamily II DNA or RNA helicase
MTPDTRAFFPDEYEIQRAVSLLVDTNDVSSVLLGQLMGRDHRAQANAILRNLGGNPLDKYDVARLLILQRGSQLLAGASEVDRKLRRHLLKQLAEDALIALFKTCGNKKSKVTQPSHMVTPLVMKPWKSGGRWPKHFTAALGFPEIFAGVRSRGSNPIVEDVLPFKPPPPLVEFQIELKDKMCEVLEKEGDRTRCVVSLPTGGGKTRVAVEAFIEWMQPRFSEGKYLVWIAQSEELCEQAIACISEMWASKEFVSPLRIYRYFGGNDLSPDQLKGGAVVASINQLHYRAESDDEALLEILKDAGAMIIDEAHRAVSMMYTRLLEKAEKATHGELFPICGLTATPGRTENRNGGETIELIERFDAYLLTPTLGDEYAHNPLKYFRDREYLAHADHIVCKSGREYRLTDDDLMKMERIPDLPAQFLKKLADDRKRNELILNRLISLSEKTPTLVYACTVKHAYFLAMILNQIGRTAGAVSAETPMAVRRGLIKAFKEGRLEFLCNYGVLTTGFDAPITECIAICRPTSSEILYEQIVGRGLRGPRFGGTERCLAIDFADNILRLGPPLAYSRFEHLWDQENIEN